MTRTSSALLRSVCISQATVDWPCDSQVEFALFPVAGVLEGIADDLANCLVGLALGNSALHGVEISVLASMLLFHEGRERIRAGSSNKLALVFLERLNGDVSAAHPCPTKLVDLGAALLIVLERDIFVKKCFRNDLQA